MTLSEPLRDKINKWGKTGTVLFILLIHFNMVIGFRLLHSLGWLALGVLPVPELSEITSSQPCSLFTILNVLYRGMSGSSKCDFDYEMAITHH